MTPKAIVKAIEVALGITGHPRQLRDVIEFVLLQKGYNPASAAELTDSLRKKVAAEIRRKHEECDEAGELAVVHLRGVDDEIVFGSSFVFRDDTLQIKLAKENRVFAKEIFKCIQALDFAQFENFGKCVLRELGCPNPRVTPHAGDQGIDFYGDVTIGTLAGADPAVMRLMHETRVIMVGQAKHYPRAAIGPSVVRELVGALSLSRTYTFSQDNIDLLSDVQLRPFSPVLALLFSTGHFTRGARNLAKKAGLIAFSGWQLAVFLADRGIGLVRKDDSLSFESSAFLAWLR